VTGTRWRRSTRCSNGACLEVAGPWTTASYSSDTWNCVEARQPSRGTVWVRDSKLGARSPVLEFDAAAWTAFIDGLKATP
jgi:hypothetical protein